MAGKTVDTITEAIRMSDMLAKNTTKDNGVIKDSNTSNKNNKNKNKSASSMSAQELLQDYNKRLAETTNSAVNTKETGGAVPFEDGGFSKKISSKLSVYQNSEKKDNNLEKYLVGDEIESEGLSYSIAHYMHLPGPGERYEDRMYDSIFRFGAYNTTSPFTAGKEFLFFTRPDLNIFQSDDNGIVENADNPTLNPGLQTGFWQDMASSKKRIIAELQNGYKKKLAGTNAYYDPFCHLLQNQCNSNLDIPSLSANAVETSTNMYGVGFSYRGSSEESDDQVEFSLEFKDTRYLDVYYFFKAYEEYQTAKHHGVVRPSRNYIMNKIIHDQFAIYKFIVDEDMETLIYWGKLYGVMPMSLPRDTFSTDNFESGLSYSINFKAAFYEDMRPEIIQEFNDLGKDYFNSLPYNIGILNPWLGRTDGRWPKAAQIQYINDKTDPRVMRSPNEYRYKLAWKGDAKY